MTDLIERDPTDEELSEMFRRAIREADETEEFLHVIVEQRFAIEGLKITKGGETSYWMQTWDLGDERWCDPTDWNNKVLMLSPSVLTELPDEASAIDNIRFQITRLR